MYIIAKNYGRDSEAFWNGEDWEYTGLVFDGGSFNPRVYIDEPIYVPKGGVVMRGFFNTKERDAHNDSVDGRTERAIYLVEGLPESNVAEVANASMKVLQMESVTRTELRRIAGRVVDR